MDAREAREHLEMVDRILTRAEPPRAWRPYPRVLVLIGIAAALLDVGAQLQLQGKSAAVTLAGIALMLGCWAYLIWALIDMKRRSARMSVVQARMGTAIRTVWIAVFLASFAEPHIFGGWAAAAIWSLGGAIQMLIISGSGDRRAMIAGGVLLASIVGANFVRGFEGYVLAAGFILGYTVPGVLYMLEKDGDCVLE